MGKSSKYPSYSGGTININGATKASTYKNKNNIITNYNMSDAEKQAYDYIQNSFANSLSSVNVFDDATKQNLQSELNAYTQNGQKLINDIYTPMINNLKTDVASRFGNFDNSVFIDNLNSIESNRADAVSNLAQDVMAKRSELINNELSQRYTYLSFLQDVQNQLNTNMFNFIGASQQNSSSGNNYNSQSYSAQNSSSGLFGNYSNLTSNLLGKYLIK